MCYKTGSIERLDGFDTIVLWLLEECLCNLQDDVGVFARAHLPHWLTSECGAVPGAIRQTTNNTTTVSPQWISVTIPLGVVRLLMRSR